MNRCRVLFAGLETVTTGESTAAGDGGGYAANPPEGDVGHEHGGDEAYDGSQVRPFICQSARPRTPTQAAASFFFRYRARLPWKAFELRGRGPSTWVGCCAVYDTHASLYSGRSS